MAIKKKVRKLGVKVGVAKQATPAPEVKNTVRAKSDRFTHDMKFAYSGDSPVVTSRRSKTPLRGEEFGSARHMVLSDRDHACMDPLLREYGKKEFQRGDLDVGIMNRLIRKGVLKHVSGDAGSDRATLKFV